MRDIERTRSWFPVFMTGALIGSGIALLTARRTGHETRETLKGIYSDTEEKAKAKAREYYDKGKEWYAELERKVKEAVQREDTASHA